MGLLGSIATAVFSSSTPSTDTFWVVKPRVRFSTPKLTEEALYKFQTNALANSILIKDDSPVINVIQQRGNAQTKLKWINKGEVLSGSFATVSAIEGMMKSNAPFAAADIDIYFHSKEDVKEFMVLNNIGLYGLDTSKICHYVATPVGKLNMIYGIPYSGPDELISKFDIRACSVAYDPNTDTLYEVEGAIHDGLRKEIIFNPVPRGCSVNRLVKYIQKGFQIDKHQRLFFSELVRSDIYSPELEITTGYSTY